MTAPAEVLGGSPLGRDADAARRRGRGGDGGAGRTAAVRPGAAPAGGGPRAPRARPRRSTIPGTSTPSSSTTNWACTASASTSPTAASSRPTTASRRRPSGPAPTGGLPRLLTPADGVALAYSVQRQQLQRREQDEVLAGAKDVDGNGTMGDPGDNMANYVWTHLFIYQDLAGTIPPGEREGRAAARRRGRSRCRSTAGPSGKSLAGGNLDYAGRGGGNIVFTDSLLPAVKNVPPRPHGFAPLGRARACP